MGPPSYMRSFVDQNVMQHIKYLEVVSVDLTLCHPSGAKDFEVDLDFWMICVPVIRTNILL